MLELLRKNAAKAGLTNVETVLGGETDPKLPAGQIDLIILVDVYHEFSQPQKMLQGIRLAAQELGWPASAARIPQRGTPRSYPAGSQDERGRGAKMRVEAEGFKLGPVIETLPRQHILIYTKAAGKGAVAGK